MLIKVGSVFLNGSKEIEIDKKVKLFEEISTADGDFSYSFELPATSNNVIALGLQTITISNKSIYNEVVCDILSDQGIVLYRGILKVERYQELTIEVTFYSGNYEWISSIQGSLKDLDVSEFDKDFTLVNAEATWNNTSGMVFPLIDKGQLSDRLAPSLVFDERIGADLYLNNDYHPFLFLQDIFKKVFSSSGLKIKGSLLNDYVFKNLITTNNAGNKGELLEARSSYVGKSISQAITSGTFTKITWIDNIDPYYDGDEDNFDNTNDRFVADVDMIVSFSVSLDFDISSSTQRYDLEVRKNGVATFINNFFRTGGVGKAIRELYAGDYLEVFAKPFTSNASCLVGSFFKVEVTKIKKIFATDVVPDFSKIDFVKNIIKMFNVVTTYDPYSRTVNLELFKNIRHKEPQDLSAYIDDKSIVKDYFEFINDYGKSNMFIYSEASTDEIETYNLANEIPYGGGSIELENTYLEDEASIAELDFVAPFEYLNENFQMSLLKLNYLGDEEEGDHALGSVTDSAGKARFNYSGTPPFSRSVGDIFRIKETSTGIYVGTGVVSAVGSTWFELAGVASQDTCTGTWTKINYTENSNEDPILALYLTDADVSGISSLWSEMYVNDAVKTTPISYAYFFRRSTGGIAADELKQGLSFGEITGNGFYQRTLIETYYRDYERVLNDPVKVIANFHLPESVFMALDFTRPVRLKHGDVGGLFYLNKISGYKASHLPCTIELIKL